MNRQKSYNRKKHPWYKRKGYLHFDYALTMKKAEEYVTNPANIITHRFSPLIHYTKVSVKIKRDKAAEKKYKETKNEDDKPKFNPKPKNRNIFYTSHVDGYIYSYYSSIIQSAYEEFLKKNSLESNVIAYRAIQKDGIKFSNINLANEAFNFIRTTNGCKVLCFDISKFFDKLSTDILKNKWAQILGEKQLPDDHFKVFQSLKNFKYVEEGQLIKLFQKRFDKNPRQHGLDKDSGGSFKNTICSYSELRTENERFKSAGKKLITDKEVLKISGVAQGTAISGLLSNIFMIDFDLELKKYIEAIGGCYRRYSDDIFIAIPDNIEFSTIELFVQQTLNRCCAGSISLNTKKTEKRRYIKNNEEFSILDQFNNPSKVQYLGFHFDGTNVYIRNSSISKDRGKILDEIRKNKKRKGKINTTRVYKRRSRRKITEYDNQRNKGFIYYAIRASGIHTNSNTITNQIKKNDRFIKKAIAKERQKTKHSGSHQI